VNFSSSAQEPVSDIPWWAAQITRRIRIQWTNKLHAFYMNTNGTLSASPCLRDMDSPSLPLIEPTNIHYHIKLLQNLTGGLSLSCVTIAFIIVFSCKAASVFAINLLTYFTSCWQPGMFLRQKYENISQGHMPRWKVEVRCQVSTIFNHFYGSATTCIRAKLTSSMSDR